MSFTENRTAGRREADGWGQTTKRIALILSIIALLGTVGKVYIAGAQVDSNTAAVAALSRRVTLLERFQVDGHYMTCYLFREKNPRAVPASCDLALSRGVQ